MNRSVWALAALAWIGTASVALAGATPAPILGAGPVGLGVLALAGAGYAGFRLLRRRRR